MSEYYDIETVVTQEATYLHRSKDISNNLDGGILEFKKRVEEDAKERLRKAGVEHFNVKVQVFLHEAMPPEPQTKPLPCPFCGAETEVTCREAMSGAIWYRIAHVTTGDVIDQSCPLAFTSKPIYMDHKTPEEAVENWNRWCNHDKA